MRMRLTDAIEHQRLQFLLPSNSLNCNQIVHIRVLTMGIIGSYVMCTLPLVRRRHQAELLLESSFSGVLTLRFAARAEKW